MIKIGMPLYTKDGRVVGNARVIKQEDPKKIKKFWKDAPLIFEIKTDYGNKAKLTENAINSMFYLER